MIELAEDTNAAPRRWWALTNEAEFAYVGEFATFDEAAEHEPESSIWLLDFQTASNWAQFLAMATNGVQLIADQRVLKLEDALQTAVNRIEDMLMGDDGQAWKEARKALPNLKALLPGATT